MAMFDACVEGILEFEDSTFPTIKRKKTFELFATKKGDMFWEEFRNMLLSTPLLLWPIQRLQVKLQKTVQPTN